MYLHVDVLKIAYHGVGPVIKQSLSLMMAVNSNDIAKASSLARSNASQGIFEHHCATRVELELASRMEEDVRGRFALEAKPFSDIATND